MDGVTHTDDRQTKTHVDNWIRLCLKAEFFAYLPWSVMRFGYAKGYANAFEPIFRVR